MTGHDFAKITVHDDGTFTVQVGGGSPPVWTTVAENTSFLEVGGISIKPRHFTDAETIGLEGPNLEVERADSHAVSIIRGDN